MGNRGAMYAAALLAALTTSLDASARQEQYDVAIVGGRVIDPANDIDAVRTVAILGGRLALVTESDLEARTVLDARGLVVAPGFIDLLASYPNDDEPACTKYRRRDHGPFRKDVVDVAGLEGSQVHVEEPAEIVFRGNEIGRTLLSSINCSDILL